MNNITYPI